MTLYAKPRLVLFNCEHNATNHYGMQSSQTVLTRVPQSTNDEFKAAVDAASDAFQSWSRTSIVTRQRFVLEYALPFAPVSHTHVLAQVATVAPSELRCHCE